MAVWPGPLPGDELPVPSQERLCSDQERVPCFPSKDPARRGEERLIRCPVDRPLHLPAQDRNLVSQNGDLELRLGRCAIVRPEQAEDAAQKEIEEGADHGAALSQIERPLPSQVATGLVYPTRANASQGGAGSLGTGLRCGRPRVL